MTTIKEKLAVIESIFNAAQQVIDGLDDKARIGISDLTDMVVAQTGMSKEHVQDFVNYYAHNVEPIAHVRRGKNGGLIKGARIVKDSK